MLPKGTRALRRWRLKSLTSKMALALHFKFWTLIKLLMTSRTLYIWFFFCNHKLLKWGQQTFAIFFIFPFFMSQLKIKYSCLKSLWRSDSKLIFLGFYLCLHGNRLGVPTDLHIIFYLNCYFYLLSKLLLFFQVVNLEFTNIPETATEIYIYGGREIIFATKTFKAVPGLNLIQIKNIRRIVLEKKSFYFINSSSLLLQIKNCDELIIKTGAFEYLQVSAKLKYLHKVTVK